MIDVWRAPLNQFRAIAHQGAQCPDLSIGIDTRERIKPSLVWTMVRRHTRNSKHLHSKNTRQPGHADIQLAHRGQPQKLWTPPVTTSSMTGNQVAVRAQSRQSVFRS